MRGVAVDKLAGDPQLEGLLAWRPDGEALTTLTSDTAITFCMSFFHRLDVDWKLHGFQDAALGELAEMTLRTVQSVLSEPGPASRDALTRRRFVARWLGPAILYPRTASLPI